MSSSRRILHLIRRLDGYGGGRMLRYLAAHQAAAGHVVSVGALQAADGVPEELRGHGIAVQVVDSRWAADPIATARIARLQRASQAEIVHAWDAVALVHACFRQSRTSHKLVASLNAKEVSRRWAPRVVRTFRNRVDAYVAADEPSRSWLESQGIAHERIHVIRGGVPRIAPAVESQAEWLTSWSLPVDAKILMAAGPLVRAKQFDEVIWAYELVRVTYPEARLLLLGDGPDRPRLERFADDVSEPGCVQFASYRGDIAALLPRADVYWQLSGSITAPWALLEAQAAGVPVVASDLPAHRAAVTSGPTGLLVPRGNRAETARATDKLFRDQGFAERLGNAAAESAMRYWSLEAAIARYDELYKSRGDQAAAG